MTIGNIFYNVIIFPLTQLLEFCYQFIYEATNKEGVAVIALSFVVTLCTLPLYMVAEKWSEKERDVQKILKPGIDRIKKAFKGDEQYMILNTFYKQNHYNPIMALRSSLSILIQIPFFIAAYHYLSELGTLKGYSFLFIKDFGSPDATFHIGTFAVNILPIAMTVINCVSGAVYSKGHSIKEKVQIYVFAAIFLIVLYNSPAGLVVYWTMNNILSLVKNIFYKIKNPKKVLYIILCIFALGCILSTFTVLSDVKNSFRKAVFAFGLVLPFIPFAVIKAAKIIDNHFVLLDKDTKVRDRIFYLSALLLALLSGFVIPSMLIQSEPGNYCFVDGYKSPFIFLFTTLFQAIGFFILWPSIFYALFSCKIKKIFSVLFSILIFGAILNTFVFGGSYGPIYPELIFMQPQVFTPSIKNILINAFVLLCSALVLILILEKKYKFIASINIILLLSMSVIGIKNCIITQSDYKRMKEPSFENELEPIFHLSKTGKNVIVIMQDRCFSPFIPYVFDEIPDLSEKFDGFKWYPNTISMGKLTMIGTPGIFGGYDYTPYRMNERAVEEPEKTLQDKHAEALLTLPALFSQNGYKVQVANLPYENYLEQPESGMYTNFRLLELEDSSDTRKNPYTIKYKNHNVIQHNHVLATYSDYWYAKHGMEKDPYISTQIFRNFIWFSFFKMVPPVLRGGIYHRDYWLSYNKWDDSARFVDNYSVIDYLPELTDFYDDNSAKGTLVLLDNEATHEPIILQAPEYEYSKNVTNAGNSILKDNTEFSTMCGIFKRYTEFFDYLKQNGVYDNTRIIVVSDHGMYDSGDNHKGATKVFKTGASLPFSEVNFAATLMVKDFDTHGIMQVEHLNADNTLSGKGKLDMTFMTNADTPYLAAKGLFEEKHPFTGKYLNVSDKNKYSILNNSKAQSTRIRHDKAFSVSASEWFTVHDNIFNKDNWSRLDSQ